MSPVDHYLSVSAHVCLYKSNVYTVHAHTHTELVLIHNLSVGCFKFMLYDVFVMKQVNKLFLMRAYTICVQTLVV